MASEQATVGGIYVFGAGIHGKIFHEALQAEGIAVAGFIDDYATGGEYQGRPLFRTDEVLNKDTEICISVGMISVSIKQSLLENGFTQVLDFTQSILKYPTIIQHIKVHSLWYSDDPAEMIDEKAIASFRALLADEKSKVLLDKITAFRRDFSVEHYVIPDSSVQYFPDDIDIFSSIDQLRFIDAGAYTGDTLEVVWQQCNERAMPLEYSSCFEPDTINLAALRDRAARLQRANPDWRIFIYPAAVWERTEPLIFESGQATSSRVASEWGASDLSQGIAGLAIDDCLYNAAPNYIKMDVEGAERSAIQGAENTIKRYQPLLAVCLYHRPADLWQLPLMLHEMSPGYRMYLRVYGDMLLETVLYCVPEG